MDFNITEEIKKEVDNYCTNLFQNRMDQYIALPTVITIYLGEEAYNYANASVKDAFASSFTVGIQTFDYVIRDSFFRGEELEEEITLYLQKMNQRQQTLGNTHVMFISRMDDPIYQQDSQMILAQIKELVENLEDYGYGIRYSFYGIFKQDMIKSNGIYYDYANAFAFVNQGKMIWKSIYHLEIKKIDSNLDLYTQMMVMNLIGEKYRMVQDGDSDEYRWKSLSMECLRLPEYILTRILNDIYSKQTRGSDTAQNEWDENVREAIETCFQHLFDIQDYQSHKYVPLLYVPPVETVKKGLFGFSKTQTMLITEVFRDADSMRQLADQLYGEIHLSQQSYDDIIENIVSALHSVDEDHLKIAQSINYSLVACKNENEYIANSLKGKSLSYDGNGIQKYIDHSYEMAKKYAIAKKKVEILDHLIQRISDGDILQNKIKKIMDVNRSICLSLDELSQRYGGTIQSISSNGLNAHSINEPLSELLKSFDVALVKSKITDKKMILDRLDRFLAFSLGSASYIETKHNLGGINVEYSHLEAISSRILMTPDQYADADIGQMVTTKYNLEKVHNPLYRSNSFYILSSREYSSDRYINRYRRNV